MASICPSRKGICFGLLGPNGAGKTTTIEMLEGIHLPTSGTVLYKGEPLGTRYREEVGIQFQHTALQEFLTVRETLELFERLYHHTIPIPELIELCCACGYSEPRHAQTLRRAAPAAAAGAGPDQRSRN